MLPEDSEHYSSVVTSQRWLGATLLISSLLASLGLRGVCRTLNAKAPKDKLVQTSSEPCCRNRSVCGRTCRCGDCVEGCSEARKRLSVSLRGIRQKLPEGVPGSVSQSAEAPQEAARPQRSQLRVSSINLAGWYTCLTLGVSAPPLPVASHASEVDLPQAVSLCELLVLLQLSPLSAELERISYHCGELSGETLNEHFVQTSSRCATCLELVLQSYIASGF